MKTRKTLDIRLLEEIAKSKPLVTRITNHIQHSLESFDARISQSQENILLNQYNNQELLRFRNFGKNMLIVVENYLLKRGLIDYTDHFFYLPQLKREPRDNSITAMGQAFLAVKDRRELIYPVGIFNNDEPILFFGQRLSPITKMAVDIKSNKITDVTEFYRLHDNVFKFNIDSDLWFGHWGRKYNRSNYDFALSGKQQTLYMTKRS